MKGLATPELACYGFVNVHRIARVGYAAGGRMDLWDASGKPPGLEDLAERFLGCTQLSSIKGGGKEWIKDDMKHRFVEYAYKDPWSTIEIFR
ncbi:hypothetical protein HDV00_011370 [Rhizophlyctis rosea]|nr:hypothetical protein HDV00_011370 [Rhizophlyctis rosea]